MPRRSEKTASLGFLLVVLIATGCTVPNPRYCPGQPFNRCPPDAGADAAGEGAGDGGDAAGDAPGPTEAADVPGEAADGATADTPEVPRDCDRDDQCTDPKRPICDGARGVCRACTADVQCNGKLGQDSGGVCLDGGCPARGDVINVSFGPGCVTSGPGTVEAPLCEIKLAVQQIENSGEERRRIIVVRGSEQTSFSATVDVGRVTIIGQPRAKVLIGNTQPAIQAIAANLALRRIDVSGEGSSLGAVPGISVSGAGAEMDLQDVTVTGSRAEGILAVSAKSVRINRVLLARNVTGLRLTQTSFSVTNTIIAASEARGAVLEGTAPPPARFQNNTLYEHVGGAALTCGAGHSASALIVYPPPGAGLASFGCPVTSSSVAVPLFDDARPYHLTPASPCKGAGDAADFPADDFDGEPRPMGGASDCGADELKEP
jgi:hypothetical protein